MARKVRGFERVLDAPSLAAVAFGEIASSIYFALGVVALYALGLTPWALLAVGLIFLLVSLSYAEATAAVPEAGGAASFVRRAFNDPAGFVVGWAVFLDYLIVIALAALFVPHYVGSALGWDGLTESPWDGVVGVLVIVALTAVRLVRRPQLYGLALVLAGLTVVTLALLTVLGFIFLASGEGLTSGIDLGSAPTWYSIAFALPLATLAFTGLETVANFAAEAKEPGKTLPRSVFSGLGAAVVGIVLIAVVGLFAFPVQGGETALGTEWSRAPLVGIAEAFEGSLPAPLVDALRIFVGLGAALVLVAAASTSISGAGRLAHALAGRKMLPRPFARLSPRTLISPVAIASAGGVASILLLSGLGTGEPARFLATLYSFGVLLAFTAAQLAVVRLSVSEPDLPRPFRIPGRVRMRGAEIPILPLVGAALTFALWIAALATHDVARIAGPLWLLAGAAIYVSVRMEENAPLLDRAELSEPDLVPEHEGAYLNIVVPLKLGDIGEEVLATALKLAEEEGARVYPLHVISVPFELALDSELGEVERRAEESLAEVRSLAAEQGVALEGRIVRARSIGEAVVEEATARNADLVVLGSAPRWRRQSRFFSPTVDYVLRHAPCEVMVVAYPQGVLDAITMDA